VFCAVAGHVPDDIDVRIETPRVIRPAVFLALPSAMFLILEDSG